MKYYVIKNKTTGMYFRGKGVNRWGKYFNQASIYRIRGTAESSLQELLVRKEDCEIVEIVILEAGNPNVTYVCYHCGEHMKAGTPFCPWCGAPTEA